MSSSEPTPDASCPICELSALILREFKRTWRLHAKARTMLIADARLDRIKATRLDGRVVSLAEDVAMIHRHRHREEQG